MLDKRLRQTNEPLSLRRFGIQVRTTARRHETALHRIELRVLTATELGTALHQLYSLHFRHLTSVGAQSECFRCSVAGELRLLNVGCHITEAFATLECRCLHVQKRSVGCRNRNNHRRDAHAESTSSPRRVSHCGRDWRPVARQSMCDLQCSTIPLAHKSVDSSSATHQRAAAGCGRPNARRTSDRSIPSPSSDDRCIRSCKTSLSEDALARDQRNRRQTSTVTSHKIDTCVMRPSSKPPQQFRLSNLRAIVGALLREAEDATTILDDALIDMILKVRHDRQFAEARAERLRLLHLCGHLLHRIVP